MLGDQAGGIGRADQSRRILGRGKVQPAVITQRQMTYDEIALLLKGTKSCG